MHFGRAGAEQHRAQTIASHWNDENDEDGATAEAAAMTLAWNDETMLCSLI